MKYINPLNTARISVSMSVLNMDQVEELCEIPAVYEQRTYTALLRHVCTPIDRPGAVADPRMWSINERMYVAAYYMSSTREDGPDFPIGKGHFHDYLLGQTDFTPEVANIGFDFEGRAMIYSPMLGYQAEAIETLIEGGTFKKNNYSWWAATMAACLRGADEDPLPYNDDAQYEAALLERIRGVRKLADPQFVGLFDYYRQCEQQAAHFVHAVTNLHGVLATQVTEPDAEKGVPELAPARFPPHSCISERARQIMGFL
ncbi:hypothetical protein [Pseudomonas sp. GD03730]|uniref:hypothetical protein n=1 Tax=Pseudomonas sp. GD03730 TaxID=2975375 RepID=UPI00244B94BB|nr:hypothetical protein [Pseudomonas sp. GD03730]MDH1403677.1 hypothetical protein [Pseudomonas sp. GD03730]